MRIPVFVSAPSELSPAQDEARKRILSRLTRLRLDPRALGRSDYPTEYPLREVAVIAKHCSGAVILGFEQIRVTAGIIKPDTPSSRPVDPAKPLSIPTPWNHLEAGIMFGLRLPLLIFRQAGVTGGVFDNGVTDVFVHELSLRAPSRAEGDAIDEVFLKWHAKVSEHYYR